MTVRRILVALVIGIAFAGCGDDHEFSVLPTIQFSATEVTDTSATLRLDVVDKGNAKYPSSGGVKVVWSEQPAPLDWSLLEEGSDYIFNENPDQEFYEVTINGLQPATVYYVNTLFVVYEWTDGGEATSGLGDENFSFTTLPN